MKDKLWKASENMQLACRDWLGLILERTVWIDDDDMGQSHLFSNIINDSYELYWLKPTGVFFLNRNTGEGTGTEMGGRWSGSILDNGEWLGVISLVRVTEYYQGYK